MLDFLSRPQRSILLVCTANICRSPAAEALLRAQARSARLNRVVSFGSAGTGDIRLRDRPDPRMVALGKEAGVSFRGIRSEACSAAILTKVDRVWCMEQEHIAALEQRFPECADKLDLFHPDGEAVIDPFYGSRQDVRNAFDVLSEIARLRIAELAREIRLWDPL